MELLHIHAYVIILTTLVATNIIAFNANFFLLLALFMDRKNRKILIQKCFVLSIISANLVLCLLWIPMEIANAVQKHKGMQGNQDFCLANSVLYRILTMIITFSTIFLGIQKVLELYKKLGKLRNYFFIIGVFFSWIIPIIIGVYSLSASDNALTWLRFGLCVNTTTDYQTHNAEGIGFVTLYSVLLSFMIVILLLVLFLNKIGCKKSEEPFTKYTHNSSEISTTRIQNMDKTLTQSNGSVLMSLDLLQPQVTSHERTGSISNDRAVSPRLIYVQGTEMMSELENLETPKPEVKLVAKELKTCNLISQVSTRRHTVANILDSIERPSESMQIPNSGYKYIRKWSVDPSALMNQLENPQLHGGNYPFKTEPNPDSDNETEDSSTEVSNRHHDETNGSNTAADDNALQMTPKVVIQPCQNQGAKQEDNILQEALLETDSENMPKALRGCVFLSLVCLVFFLPYHLTNILRGYQTNNVYLSVSMCCTAFSMIPSAIQPFLFVYLCSRIRCSYLSLKRKLMKKLYCKCTENEQQDHHNQL